MDQALTSQELFIPTHHPVWIFPFTLVRDRSAQARALPPSHPRYRPTARPHAFTLTRCTLGTPHTARHNTRHLRTWTLGPAPRLRPGPHGPHAHGPSPRPFGSDPARPSPLYTPRAQSMIGHEPLRVEGSGAAGSPWTHGAYPRAHGPATRVYTHSLHTRHASHSSSHHTALTHMDPRPGPSAPTRPTRPSRTWTLAPALRLRPGQTLTTLHATRAKHYWPRVASGPRGVAPQVLPGPMERIQGGPEPCTIGRSSGLYPGCGSAARSWLGPRIRFPGGTGGGDYIKEITPQSLPQPASRPR